MKKAETQPVRAKFKHFPDRPKKLTAEFAKKLYDKLLARTIAAEAASAPDLWLKLFADWNELGSYVSAEGSRINHAYSKNMADKKLEAADEYFREKIIPAINKPAHQMMDLFLKSRHRQAVAKRYGRQLIVIFEKVMKPFDPINTALRTKASKLTKDYDKMVAGAMVTVQGQKMTLWQASDLLESPDESIRKEAYLATRGWVLDNRQKLADIYDKLVKLRHQMAKKVGYKTYIPLGYESMGRTDYNEAMAAQFRKNVHKYATPIIKELSKKQTQTLGKKILRPWDMYDPQLSLPLGIVPVDGQIKTAKKMFDKLNPRFGKHFEFMVKNDLIDLENRPNKRSGAYCTEFTDQGLVAILCNSTGNADDVQTLTHEMGHAFQGWESQHIEAVDLQWGTYDLAEVFSMGMEFLTLPYIEDFFSQENAEKFRRGRWERAVGILCYVCVVDEFQHWVYKNPRATKAQRDEKWIELGDKYIGRNVDFSGYEKYQKTRWYLQGHIFSMPFYYIDYALAETAAMQLGLRDLADHKKTMQVYLKLCRLGGTKSFLEALQTAGLVSPFDESLMRDLMDYARKVLI